ncbi:MAG: hypothetical protein IT454_21040 [Planctomycetes bacterium]|nr:hypothetical protein [Planctomycetota bacterium]
MHRTPIQFSGGNSAPPNDCSGVFSFDFNAWMRSGVDPALHIGSAVHAQFWLRDGSQPSGAQTSFSDALCFEVGP